MDFETYEREAAVTRPDYQSFIGQLTVAALGLNGEAGEFADLLKKHIAQGHPLDVEKMKNEIGDILWYMADAADALGVSLGEIAAQNIAKLRRRYPNGQFEAERSLNRNDG